MLRYLLGATVVLTLGCVKRTPEPRAEDPQASSRAARQLASMQPKSLPEVRSPHRCFGEDDAGSPERPIGALLDRAADRYDAADYDGALLCADEATRQAPRSVEAHHNRATALAQLGRLDDARTAFTLALALDPEDPETLAGAADLYVNRLPPSAELTEIGLQYARYGSRNVKHAAADRRKPLGARLALLEGQALDDLGRAKEALPRLDAALVHLKTPENLDAEYERGVALFELCRFSEAKQVFEKVLGRNADNAYAHYHLALILERDGKLGDAQSHFSRSYALSGKDFVPPFEISPEAFRKAVRRAVDGLPADLKGDLKDVPVQVEDLPATEDLTAEDPPLSPTILGLYRGLPLGQSCPGEVPEEKRSIVLYRKNLARTVSTMEDLEGEIRKTLLHEIGHLHGEDDLALRSRGLE